MSGEDDKLLAQEEIEKLLSKSGKAPPKEKTTAASQQPSGPPAVAAEAPSEAVSQDDVEYLLNHAQEALDSIDKVDSQPRPVGISQFTLESLHGAPASTEAATIDLIRDVDLDLKIELGRTHMYLEDVLKLHKGSVVSLDKLAGDPVDIYVNGRLIARGEVLVLNDNFCVRVAELIAGAAAG